MSRFKFRAWGKNGKRYNSETETFEPHMITDVGISIKHGDYLGWFTHLNNLYIRPESDNFVLMQCTGLKDQEGQDIYEGDIVLTDDYDVWGVVSWDERGFRFYLKDDYDNFGLDEFQPEHLKVIGNIYENPDLLK